MRWSNSTAVSYSLLTANGPIARVTTVDDAIMPTARTQP
jgi:hypothetical protein